MITFENIPKNLKKLDELVLCSNLVKGGGFPFAVKDVLPLIIGGGERPQVWLQAVIDPSKNLFLPIVDNSISKDSNIKVFEDQKTGVMQIYLQNIPILQVKLDGEKRAVISLLDLRPLGLNIWGNSNELHIVGSRFSKNTVEGVGVFINLGL